MNVGLRWSVFGRVSWIWSFVERLFLRIQPLTPVGEGTLFAYRVHGDVVQLHLEGRALNARRRAAGYSTFKAVHELRAELGVLASRIRRGELGDVRVLKGTSLIGAAGGVLGFETRTLPRSLGAALEQYFLVGLDAIHHPRGLRVRATRRWPVETTMTVSELLRRYPEKSARSTVAR
jgi:hypothetical protein